MQDMLKSLSSSPAATGFYQTYYVTLVSEVFAVMTDTFHTPGFKVHCRILSHLFGLTRPGCNVITAPLWDVSVSVLCCVRLVDCVHHGSALGKGKRLRMGHGIFPQPQPCSNLLLNPVSALFHMCYHRHQLSHPLCSQQAKGPAAYPNNAAYVTEYVTGLLSSSFKNMTPLQVQAAVAGMMGLEDRRAFKHHMRDFLVQV